MSHIERLSRRGLFQLAGKHLLAYSLASLLHRELLAADPEQEKLDAWFKKYESLGDRLIANELTSEKWQLGMDQLLRQLSLPQLMKSIDYDRMSEKLKTMPLKGGEVFHPLFYAGKPIVGDGKPEPTRAVVTKLAYIKKGSAIPPHGHTNMVSAFLQLSGEFHVKQYDKIADERDHLIVRKTMDAKSGVGEWSSISDTKNNVHWIRALSEDCFLFTTKITEVQANKPVEGRVNIDVLRAAELGESRLRAEKINGSKAAELYG